MGEPAQMDELTPLGITQDGIPVSTDLSITFMLDPGHTTEPREGKDPTKPPYEFNATAVEKAVYGHAYSEFDDLPWTELPLRLAIDLWREKVKEKSINELVNIAKDENPPMELIKEDIQTRLTSPTVESRGQNGQRQLEPSREYDVLRSRGVRVLSIGGMHSLFLPDEVRQERMLHWRESWAGTVHESLSEAREEIKHIRRRGEAEACAILLRDLTVDLRQQLQTESRPGMQSTLKSILSSALRLSSQRGVVADGANLAIHLSEIIDELSSLDENCSERGHGGG
jgi:hypothetical protein